MTLVEARPTSAAAPRAGGLPIAARTLRDHRRGLLGWALGLIGLTLAVAAVYPSVAGQTEFDELVESYPEAVMALFGAAGMTDITEGANFMTVELFGLMVPLLLAIFGIGFGSGAVAGAEERGTLEVVLSCPVRRERYVLEQAVALAAAIGVLATTQALTLLVVSPVFDIGLAVSHCLAASLAVGLLGLFLGATALLVGAATGRRALAMAVASAVGVVSYLVSGLAELVSWLEPFRPLSVFHYTVGPQPLIEGIAWGHLGLVAVASAVLVALAVARFAHRDLRTR